MKEVCMQNIQKFRRLYALKEVYRHCSVGNRKESVAEHTWSALMLADYILTKSKIAIDRVKVYELLLYHDIVEIEAGDIPIHHEEKRIHKQENERKAIVKLNKQLPKEVADKLAFLFEEFEAQQTPEAKFARAIDKLDATIHELDYKEDWKGWNEKMLRKYHDHAVSVFPETKKLFEKIVAYVKKNDYFRK